MPWRCILCLTKHHAKITYGGVEILLHAWLTLALDGHEWSVSCPSCFTPRERAPSTHLIGGWVGPRASLNMVANRKNPYLCWESSPGHPVHSLVNILTELPCLFRIFIFSHIILFLEFILDITFMSQKSKELNQITDKTSQKTLMAMEKKVKTIQ